MKIVIVSDTHGSRKNIENVCECNPDADMLIHLGDVEDDDPIERPAMVLFSPKLNSLIFSEGFGDVASSSAAFIISNNFKLLL